MHVRSRQGACGHLGLRSGMSAKYKDLLIEQNSDMLTFSEGGRQLTLSSS